MYNTCISIAPAPRLAACGFTLTDQQIKRKKMRKVEGRKSGAQDCEILTKAWLLKNHKTESWMATSND